MPGAMEDNKWELKYGQIAILERHTLGLGLKRIKKNKKLWIKKKKYQRKIQNQIEKEIPLSLGRFLSLYIYIYLN